MALTKLRHGKRTFGILLPMLYLYFASALFAAEDISIGRKDIVETRSKLEAFVQDVVYSNLLFQGIRTDYKSIGVSTNFEFDNKRLRQDQVKWEESNRKRSKEMRSNYIKSQRDLLNALRGYRPETKPIYKKQDPVKKIKERIRFGRLNLDIGEDSLSDITSRDNILESEEGKSLSLNLQIPDRSMSETFTYDPIDYIVKLSFVVRFPETSAEFKKELIEQVVKEELARTYLIDKSVISNFVIETIPTPKIQSEKFVDRLIDPEGNFLGLGAMALLLGLFGLIGAVLVTNSFKNIAAAVSELKVDVDGGVSTEGGLGAATAIVEQGSDAQDPSGDKKFDSGAHSRALTSEMERIRKQFGKASLESPEIVAELIRDMLYDEKGLSNYKDILGFLEYSAIRPAIELLPQGFISKVNVYIEENSSVKPDILNGVEITQQLYSESISKLNSEVDQCEKLKKLRDTLLKVEDDSLTGLAPSLESNELALIIRILTAKRSAFLIKHIPKENLKDTFSLLNTKMGSLVDNEDALISKINEATDAYIHSSGYLERFILRMTKTMDIEEEDQVYDMFPIDNWALRMKIMRTRMFYKDLIYVPTDLVVSVLSIFDVNQRAEILYVVEEEIRSNVLGSYEEGSKLKNMLTEVLGEIEKNDKRKSEVEKNRWAIATAFMNRLRGAIEADPAQVERIVLMQCQALGLIPPEELTKVAKEKAAQEKEEDAARSEEVTAA